MTHTENAGAEEANKKYTTKEKKSTICGLSFYDNVVALFVSI